MTVLVLLLGLPMHMQALARKAQVVGHVPNASLLGLASSSLGRGGMGGPSVVLCVLCGAMSVVVLANGLQDDLICVPVPGLTTITCGKPGYETT